MKLFRVRMFVVALVVILAALVSLSVGRYTISPFDTITILCAPIFNTIPTWTHQAQIVVCDVRAPRVLAVLLVGAALGLSGATYQGIFRNPLVSPDLLGVSAGACVGAAVAILLHWSSFGVQVAAFSVGLLTVALATCIPRIFMNNSNLMLVLSGVIMSGFMHALIGLAKYFADPDNELASIVYWTLGSFASIKMTDVLPLLAPILISLVVLICLRWRIDLLSMGDENAASVGVSVGRLKGITIICATLATAGSVCLCGTIGWVGLVVPHICRLITGASNRYVLPLSTGIGALFLLVVDTIARNISGSEIPLSILTGLLGAPLFFALLYRQRGQVW